MPEAQCQSISAVRPSVAAHLALAELLEQHGRHELASPHFKACLNLAHAR